MNKEELIGLNDYKSIYSKPFELNLDYIRNQCHFMEKEDIYKWLLNDEIRITNLKQALIDIEKLLTEPTLEAIWKIPKCITIIDKALGGN